MRSLRTPALVVCLWLSGLLAATAAAGPPTPRPGAAAWKPGYKFPVFGRIEARRDSLQALTDSARATVDARYAQQKKEKDDLDLSLRVDWSGIELPASPDAFAQPFHFPPVPQYNTGTCWAFCSTSFFESEAARLSGRRVKLSEMWTVYWEYVEKARRFVREYGHSPLVEGSEDEGTQQVYRLYGVVPREVYGGVLDPAGWYDHPPMQKEIAAFLQFTKERGYWNEAEVIAHVRAILDRHMGRPPESFAFEGKTYTPRAFLTDVLKLDPDDYVDCMSTLKVPFYQYGLFDVPDNWRRSDRYLNLPLDVFYRVITETLRSGGTVALGGDTSEPGMDGMAGAAVIPPWDIPARFIDQDSRELRIANGTTTDDHGMHAIGFLRHGGRDWLLIKDSNQSSRLGRFKGYYFYAGDYVRLKTLTCLVPKSRLAGLLPKP